MVEAKEGRLITWVAAGVAKVTPSVTAALGPPVGKGVSKQSGVLESPSCSSARMALEDFTLRLGGVLTQGRVCLRLACGMVMHKGVYTNKLRVPGLEADRKAPDHQVTVGWSHCLVKIGLVESSHRQAWGGGGTGRALSVCLWSIYLQHIGSWLIFKLSLREKNRERKGKSLKIRVSVLHRDRGGELLA